MSAAHRWHVHVFYEGQEVYSRGFTRRSKALEFFWWRIGIMEDGSARTPGDTVLLVNEHGSIEEEYDREGPITNHRQRFPVSAH